MNRILGEGGRGKGEGVLQKKDRLGLSSGSKGRVARGGVSGEEKGKVLHGPGEAEGGARFSR